MARMTLPVDGRFPSNNKLTGQLGVASILFMVLAAAAPLGVVAGAVPIGALLGNGAGLPGLFVIASFVLLLFAVGLSAMAARIPRPGAFFSYIGAGLGRPAGVAAAWLAWLTYTAMQLALYAYVGQLITSSVRSLGGPELHWAIYSVVLLIVVGILGYRHIDLSAKVLSVLLVLEVSIVLILVAAIAVQGGAEGLSALPFEPSVIASGAPGVGLVFVIGAFIGFESVAIFRSEARDPEKTVPRATYLAVIGVGIFYSIASWGLVMGWGPSDIAEVIAANLDDILVVTTVQYLGVIGGTIINVLLLTSFFASILAFHNIVTRYQHTMGNANLLPQPLSGVHAKHQSPHISSVVQSATALILVVICAILGLDPILAVFSWFAGVATLSVVVLMFLTSVAIITYFSRNREDQRLWNTKIAPILGMVGLAICAVLIIAYFPVLVGDVSADGEEVFGPTSVFLLGLVAVFPALGAVQAWWLRRLNPATYQSVIHTIQE